MKGAAELLGFLQPDSSVDDAKAGLVDLWRVILDRLSAEDRADLGDIHVGRTGEEPGAYAWAQTNADEDRVNLTLELKHEQLELNIVGWKEAQAEQLKDWLQSVQGEKVVAGLTGYEVVAFARRAYKKTPASKPWWQYETIELLGSCPAADYDARFIVKMMVGLGSRKEVKPSFHVRVAWRRNPPPDLASLVDEMTAEVERLVVVLRAIWSHADSAA